jgi:DNA-binding CsgD family transcriptional regulator
VPTRTRSSSVTPPPFFAALRPLWDMDASGWFAYGPDGRLAYVNRAFQRLTGSRPGLGTTDLVPEVAAERRQALRRTFHRLRAGDDEVSSWIAPVVVGGVATPLHLSLTAIGDRRQPAKSVVGLVTPVAAMADRPVDAERAGALEQMLGRVMHVVSTALNEDEHLRVLDREDLSPRQRDVLRLLLHGDRPADVAAVLHLSTHTVRNYEKALFRKFGVHSQAELVAVAKAMHRHPSARSR